MSESYMPNMQLPAKVSLIEVDFQVQNPRMAQSLNSSIRS
uniref:Uncharacterized protein n=1 Tax=Anguilla anguilla TaxID=7936 RepID=A0A0E9Q772_ANGAN